MEAIIALLTALIEAVIQAMLMLVGLVASTIAILMEALIVALTNGPSAASKRYQQRRAERRERSASDVGMTESAHPEAPLDPAISLRAFLMIIGLSGVIMVCVIIGWTLHEQALRRRVAATELLVQETAASVAARLKADKDAVAVRGPLTERDAWGANAGTLHRRVSSHNTDRHSLQRSRRGAGIAG